MFRVELTEHQYSSETEGRQRRGEGYTAHTDGRTSTLQAASRNLRTDNRPQVQAAGIHHIACNDTVSSQCHTSDSRYGAALDAQPWQYPGSH